MPTSGIGLVILAQVPTVQNLAGIALVIAGVALHHDPLPHVPATALSTTPEPSDSSALEEPR